ncbi:SAM-dependent methyltransferase, partial [Cupriavidus sp. SIMBA_020]
MQRAHSSHSPARRWPLMASALALALTLAVLAEARADAASPRAAATEDYVPDVGQDGKDVIWVPTPQALVDKMLDMARVTPRDR